MDLRRPARYVVLLLLFVGSTDLPAQRLQALGIRSSPDSTAPEVHTRPDFACGARRVAFVGAGSLVGMAMGRVIFEIGNLIASDHGSIYTRGRRHWETGGAVIGGSMSALLLVVSTCDDLASQAGTVRRPPPRRGF